MVDGLTDKSGQPRAFPLFQTLPVKCDVSLKLPFAATIKLSRHNMRASVLNSTYTAIYTY